jgi:hypothetical protein
MWSRARDPADAFVRMLYPDTFCPGGPRSDDLSADAGVPRDPDVLYAMRPATVRTAVDPGRRRGVGRPVCSQLPGCPADAAGQVGRRTARIRC